MSWNGETNPHFWPRDPPRPPVDQPGSSRQQPGRKIRPRERPEDIHLPPPIEPVTSHPQPSSQVHQPEDQPGPARRQPGRKIRPQERPDHVRLPLPVEPTGSYPQPPEPDPQAHQPGPTVQQPWRTSQGPAQRNPQAHQSEYELTPAGHDPELVIPATSRDHWPMHPHEPSQDHWPLQPHQPSQDGPTQPPRPRPKRQRPHMGPPTGPPPARRYGPPVEHPDHSRPSKEQDLIYPSPDRTNPCTWFIAVFCVIIWVVIILGGILILIIYLVYRPRNPHFEISNASLNAAYLDMGYLLNADLTLLVNFTNPNEKMSVDFNFIVLKLTYENHLIANQYIEPFSATKLEHKFARVEMVSSQIRLPVLVTQQLIKQIQGNRITFELDGYFHARSRLGSIFRYSYWLYSHCTIITKGPPSGVMVFSKCITKR